MNDWLRGSIHASGNDFLLEGGGADVAQPPGRSGHGGVDPLAVLRLVRDADVADALSRQGEGFGVGVADDGAGVDVGDEGGLRAVVAQLPVGLVRQDVDGVAVLLGLAGENLSQTFQRLLGVHHAGGVAGGSFLWRIEKWESAFLGRPLIKRETALPESGCCSICLKN